MRSKGPRDFPETLEKDVLRTRDLGFLKELSAEKGRSLRYLGLSGSEALDVLKWKDSLGHVVVIERPIGDEDAESRFSESITFRLTRHFNGNLEIVFADIWKYLASDEFAKMAVAPDVVNLDFCGGLVYSNMEYPVQRLAFQGLFSRQRQTGEDFLLLLTLMPRDKGRETYTSYLRGQVDALKALGGLDRSSLEENFQFHCGSQFLLFKACLPILLAEIGRSYNFHVETRLMRKYTKMLHLAFRCRFQPGSLGLAPTPTLVVRTLEAPLRKLLPNGQEDRDTPPAIS